ncbi:undecaprenyl-diphosphate phosphatase [Candidatus Pseudomonas adelgestsugas]|uniref:Undecaprenyl-diphosphatase n=1 Tax=Candidatus Pseudomonas adelgestsugas TaxID=1302376 RepID=A0ABX5R844_9PSED|nr:undecaprenyl-diphosphate phosphatase [Candidatus Pseudomonas adelgestsugas]QAX81819.1 Undecaprenyl-diphosphatase [Candidatus Pseudomonas adelgestsugas]
MNFWVIIQALILGVVEGLTEFLPISSTGHQIIIAELIGFEDKHFKLFNIIIQLGAILAVIWEFRRKILNVILSLPNQRNSQRLTVNLIVALLPAVALGMIVIDLMKHDPFSPIIVAITLVVGGMIMLWVESRQHLVHAKTVYDITWKDALKVGVAQCFSIIPGTSRSGATIICGLLSGLSRTAATEFSFFLAIPTMIGAAVYSCYKYRDLCQQDALPLFAIGFVASFIFAMMTVKALLKFIASHSYAAFAWYRIAFGLIILTTWHFGWINWTTVLP